MRTGPRSKWKRPAGAWSTAPNGTACHQDLRKVAVEMAHEVYATLMSKNEWYDALKLANPGVNTRMLERGWVNAHWHEFLEAARANLAMALRGPLPEPLKAHIHEVLILDATLTRGRRTGRILAADAAGKMTKRLEAENA